MAFNQFGNDGRQSLTRFESMLKTNSLLFFDSNEFENIIQHYLEIGKVALAKKAIKMGLGQHPDSVTLRLFQAEIYVLENKLSKAEHILETLLDIEPSNVAVYIQKANICSLKDLHEEAAHLLITALQFTEDASDTADIHAMLGMEYMYLEEFENAKNQFITCLEIDEEDYAALYNLMYCFDFLEQSQDAVLYLTDYLNINPYCEIAWHQLGKQYAELEDYKSALTAFDYAIISDDTFIGAYFEKGKVLEKIKNYHEAIENYKITLTLDDPTSFALLRIGCCYEKLKQDTKALHYFYKTVHEDPLLDKGWMAISKHYDSKDNFQKALYYVNKAINIDDENPYYWKFYALLNQKLDFLEEAERGYKKTLDLGDQEFDTWISRSDILLDLGEYKAAILTLNQAAELFPDSESILYRIAGLYFLALETEKGLYYLKYAYKLNPEFVVIFKALFPKVTNLPSLKKVLLDLQRKKH